MTKKMLINLLLNNDSKKKDNNIYMEDEKLSVQGRKIV